MSMHGFSSLSLMDDSSGAVNAGSDAVDDKGTGDKEEMMTLEQILEMIYPSDADHTEKP